MSSSTDSFPVSRRGFLGRSAAWVSAVPVLGRPDAWGSATAPELSGVDSAGDLGAGIGLVRNGAGTALVGDPDAILLRLREYQAVGIDDFILSGYPHLEEAYRVAEWLFPALRPELPEEPSGADVRATVRASGEVIAHNLYGAARSTDPEPEGIAKGPNP